MRLEIIFKDIAQSKLTISPTTKRITIKHPLIIKDTEAQKLIEEFMAEIAVKLMNVKTTYRGILKWEHSNLYSIYMRDNENNGCFVYKKHLL